MKVLPRDQKSEGSCGKSSQHRGWLVKEEKRVTAHPTTANRSGLRQTKDNRESPSHNVQFSFQVGTHGM